MENTKEYQALDFENKKYWDEFYKEARIQEESTFCKYIKNIFDKNTIILDVGCGSGRDTFSFAKENYDVVGIDRSKEAIRFNQSIKEQLNKKVKNIEFHTVDLSNPKLLSEIIIRLSNKAELERKNLVIYLRFLLHSINEKTEEIMLTTLSNNLPKGSIFVAEFRTIEDKKLNKVYGNHYRRFIIAEKLLSKLKGKYNFSEILFVKGTGFSIYKGEDPYLARIIMEKN
jgi:tellurite methyltransferase